MDPTEQLLGLGHFDEVGRSLRVRKRAVQIAPALGKALCEREGCACVARVSHDERRQASFRVFRSARSLKQRDGRPLVLDLVGVGDRGSIVE